MAFEWPAPGTTPEPYRASLGAEAAKAEFERVRGLLSAIAAADERQQLGAALAQALQGLDDPSNLEAYQHCVPLVERLIGAEFDTTTPGKRGIGRLSTGIPRLGGQLRAEIRRPDTRVELGPRIERLLLAGFAAAAAATYQTAADGPPQLREFDLERVWTAWIPNAYAGLRGNRTLDAVIDEPLEQFFQTVDDLGILGRLSRRKRLRARTIGFFYGSAGAALYEANTDRLADYMSG